jgi:hypothetical protein
LSAQSRNTKAVMKVAVSNTTFTVFGSGLETATRMMNARMSVTATDDKITLPDSFSSMLYCITITEIIEMEGTAMASATTKSEVAPKGKKTAAIANAIQRGMMKEVIVRSPA